jgi:hypothetical protein
VPGEAYGLSQDRSHEGPATVSSDLIRTIIEVVTLVVVAASAAAALFQLRQVRSSNQLRALVAVEATFQAQEMQEALRFVQFELPKRLEDAAYRSELSTRGFVDPLRHPEMRACNWFEALGAMFKHDLVDENGFMEIFARLVIWYWGRLGPVIALLRRNRSQTEYHNFEYLAVRAGRWVDQHPEGIFPKRYARLPVVDVWHDADAG